MKEIITDLTLISDICDKVVEGESFKEIVTELKRTIKKLNLKSLSAPAIGYNKRIFCINYDLESKTYINPLIVKSEGVNLVEEICTSIPGKHFIVPRAGDLDVIYTDTKGEIVNKHLSGLAAYVFQHELDHLNGITLNDYGLEIDEDYLNATDEEKQEIITLYITSLRERQSQLEKEIAEDSSLAAIDEHIRFGEAVARGEVEFLQSDKEVTNEFNSNEENR